MAYVRKTDTLVESIKKSVRRIGRAAEDQYDSKKPEIGTDVYKSLRASAETSAWADAPELRGKLPLNWIKEHDSITAHFKVNGITRIELDTAKGDRFLLPFRNDMPGYFPSVEVREEHCTAEALAWLAETTYRDDKATEIRKQFNDLEYQLVAFMDKHASLNSAVKEMPELELYVPQEYLTKLREATPPRAKPEKPSNIEALNIDVNALASAAIAHRITSSQSV